MNKLFHSNLFHAQVDLYNKRIYFWRGSFSQWYKSPIEDPLLNVTANCAEQLMMAHKAYMFGDGDIMRKILATNNSREQKNLGRQVKGYVDETWAATRLAVVTQINYLKFSQNEGLKELLLLTDGYDLVEASPEDTIWGVGLAEDDPLILNKANWLGTNLLGQALMNAREQIVSEL